MNSNEKMDNDYQLNGDHSIAELCEIAIGCFASKGF